MAQWLAARLGQPVVVENQAGSPAHRDAAVVHAPADGYTLLLAGPANAISASLPEKLDFVFLRDIAPGGGITREPLVLVVHPRWPAASVAELIAHAKATQARSGWRRPALEFAARLGRIVQMLTGVDVETVHYAGGGPASRR